MASGKSKRIVFDAPPEATAALEQTADRLELSKVGTIRLAVSVLAEIAAELDSGGKIILRDENNNEREVWLPQIGLRKMLRKSSRD